MNVKKPNKREALYRTMHNSMPGYRNHNWGLITLHYWLPHLGLRQPASILEVGCGNGKLCQMLSDMKYNVVGLDIVSSSYDRKDYDFVKHDLASGRLPFKDKEFDYCVSFDVLEHLEGKWVEEVIWDMFRVTRKKVIIVVPCIHKVISPLMKELHLTVKSAEWWIEKMNRQADKLQPRHILILPDKRAGEHLDRLLFCGASE